MSAVNLAEAGRFLDFMAEGEPVTLQTFDDDAGRKAPGLARIRHGDLDQHAAELKSLNAQGAGVFWMVNAGNGKGRTNVCVSKIRALFLDLDGASLQPVLNAGVQPHAVIESSPGKWHVYWVVTGCQLGQFKAAQTALAAKFGGDPSVNDLPRVMRLPGFLHRKGEPFVTRIESLEPMQPYVFDDLVQRLGLDVIAAPAQAPTQPARPGPDAPKVQPGGRHAHLVRWAAQMNWRGMPAEAVRVAVQHENLRVCDPPKTAAEVDAVVSDVLKRYSGQHGRDSAADDFGQEHPLARFVDLGAEPMAPRWVIPGFIGQGLVIFAGAHGAGKTTALLPLSMVAAGLHGQGDPLAPRHWRHVVYVTEDTDQAQRILAGIVRFGGLGLNVDTVRERLHIVEARRLDPAYVVQVAPMYRAQFTRLVDGVEVLPLAVFDTKSAVFAQEEENSNTEASQIVALLKQDFADLPAWVVGHIAKASMSRADAAGLSLRGGGAFEADANQVLYLVKEGEARYLVRGKTRFEAEWPELQIRSATAATMALDEFGEMQAVTLRWGIAAPPEVSRKEAQEQAQEAQHKADAAALRDEVRDAIDVAWLTGFPLNRAGVRAKVKRRGEDVGACIENLLSERWLHEVAIPAKERTNPRRGAFLVTLTAEEHAAAVRGEGLPAAKLAVPESWRKPAAPIVPEPEQTGAEEPTTAEGSDPNSVRSRSVRSLRKKNTGTDGELGCSPVRPFIPQNPEQTGNDRERSGTIGNGRTLNATHPEMTMVDTHTHGNQI